MQVANNVRNPQYHVKMEAKDKQLDKMLACVIYCHMMYLLLELRQLSRQVGHQPHGWLQLLLQVPDFILLPLRITAHQGHGTHPWEPIQVVLLVVHQAYQPLTFFLKKFFIQKCCCIRVNRVGVMSDRHRYRKLLPVWRSWLKLELHITLVYNLFFEGTGLHNIMMMT